MRTTWLRGLRTLALLGGMGMLLSAGMARAQNTVESVSASVQSGVEVVRIDFSAPLSALPNGFSIQSPARIALDIPGASNGLRRNAVEINQGNLRSVNVVEASDRTRLVLNLKVATTYKTQLQGKSLLVLLDPPVAAAGGQAAAPVFAESRNRDVLPLKDIDFRRGSETAGRVVFELASSQVGVDIRPQGQNLVVEFLKSSLPDSLRRRMDVGDFGTPVQSVTAFQTGDRVRVVIEPRGQWEHSAYQTDTQFVVEVRPQRVDSNKLSQGPGYTGEKLSLNFQAIEVRALLQVIADFTNFNIITSDSVAGSVTLRLKDVPWDQALDVILQARGLGMRKAGNVLWIAPRDELAARERLELESKAAIQNVEPVRTQSFQLNYTRAEQIAAALAGTNTLGAGANQPNSRLLSPRGSVLAETRTNQLFVTDIPTKLEQVERLIAQIDVPVRQVMIEARIVQASDSFGKSLGVRLGGSDLRGVRGGDPGYGLRGSNRVAIGGSYDAVSGTTGEGSTQLTTANTSFVNLPATGQGGYSPSTFALSLFSAAANRFLNLELSALEADGKGKLVSSPRIVTADKKKALIKQGTEFPYQQATASGATAVQFRTAALSLEVTPQITPEGNVTLALRISKDSRGETTAAGVAIDTKHIETEVLVENGGTVVIGGIFELTETENESRVPVLGDLPGVGNLFKSKSRSTSKQELLVFITPKVLADRGAAR